MRKMFIFLNLLGLLLSVNQITANAKNDFEIPVEVTEIKDLGLSDRDESKSVIEVCWRAEKVQKEKIVFFSLVLSVTYADGATVSARRRFEKNLTSARIEVSSVKIFGGKPSAFIKHVDARVFAVVSKN